jgi:DNA-binding transcriptional regulator YiaG
MKDFLLTVSVRNHYSYDYHVEDFAEDLNDNGWIKRDTNRQDPFYFDFDSTDRTVSVAGISFWIHRAPERKPGQLISEDEPAETMLRLLIASQLGQFHLRRGDALAYIRQALGMDAVAFARFLDLTPEIIKYWEDERITIPRPSWTLTVGILEECLGRKFDLLSSYRSSIPETLPAEIEIWNGRRPPGLAETLKSLRV